MSKNRNRNKNNNKKHNKHNRKNNNTSNYQNACDGDPNALRYIGIWFFSTFAILMLATLATLRNRKQVVVFYRKINQTYIIRAITLTMLSIFIVIVAIINMSFSCNLNLENIIFHCVSAYSMTGLGLFPASILNFAGKINTILLMFIGRVGPIVFLRIFFAREKQKDELKYAEGELIL